MLLYETLSEALIAAFIEVSRALSPGLLESTYSQCLAHELTLRGIPFRMECPIPVGYKGVKLDCGYRADFIVDDRIIVELKSVEKLLPIHEAQLLTYMKLTGLRLGFLVNFNSLIVTEAMIRRVL